MGKPRACNKCGQLITFERSGVRDDGSIRWKPVDAQTGKDHDKDACAEIARTGSTDGNGKVEPMTSFEPEVKLIERDKHKTVIVLGNTGGNRWVIDIRKLNGSRMD